jgi:Ca2+:H+ antiporter
MRGQVYSGRAKGIRVAARSGVSKWLRRHWTLVLLVSIPVAALLEFLAPERQTAIFVATTVAIVPLAAYIGRATDALANRLGGGIGGLLNATFGNAAELIIVRSRCAVD